MVLTMKFNSNTFGLAMRFKWMRYALKKLKQVARITLMPDDVHEPGQMMIQIHSSAPIVEASKTNIQLHKA